ncbi:MAG: arylsulfatase [Kiritimatiellae bacterium]|nr:arylsulfatase [Kiritimatiellia bacterium]
MSIRKKVFRFGLAVTAFLVCSLTLPLRALPAGSKPNVIFILCDDLGYGDLGCYGQQKNKTPHIDALAQAGMLFTDHYSGSTVCAPSRSVLMTGQHTGHTPVRGNGGMGKRPDGADPQSLPASTYTMPKMFKSAGYQSGMFGKWGLGSKEDAGNALKQGFDAFYGYYDQSHAHTYYPMFLWDNNTMVEMDGHTYSHDLIWGKGLEFIRKNARSKTPFFCYYSITVPHASMSAPPELHEKWRKVYPEFEKVVGKYGGKGMGKDREVINPIAGFAAMIENLDNQVGELMAELKSLGVDQSTLVIFTSDNGAHREGGHDPEFWSSNGPLRGLKRSLTDGGIRTPMVMRWPEVIQPGRRTAHVSAFWDFLPTFAAMAGATIPSEAAIDGISMLPLIAGDESSQAKHKVLYWAFNEGGPKQAIRAGQWKLIRYRNNKTGAHEIHLYDIEKDISEEDNLAQKFPEVVSQCLKLMDEQHSESPYYPIEQYGVTLAPGPREKRESIAGKPIVLECSVDPAVGAPDGVLMVRGGQSEGLAVYVKSGKLTFTVCRSGKKTTVTASEKVPAKPYTVKAALKQGGRMSLLLEGIEVAAGSAGGLLSREPGEPFSIGEDNITAAGEYEIPFKYKGRITDVKLNGNKM